MDAQMVPTGGWKYGEYLFESRTAVPAAHRTSAKDRRRSALPFQPRLATTYLGVEATFERLNETSRYNDGHNGRADEGEGLDTAVDGRRSADGLEVWGW
mgnify:CR=1 FL=1